MDSLYRIEIGEITNKEYINELYERMFKQYAQIGDMKKSIKTFIDFLSEDNNISKVQKTQIIDNLNFGSEIYNNKINVDHEIINKMKILAEKAKISTKEGRFNILMFNYLNSYINDKEICKDKTLEMLVERFPDIVDKDFLNNYSDNIEATFKQVTLFCYPNFQSKINVSNNTFVSIQMNKDVEKRVSAIIYSLDEYSMKELCDKFEPSLICSPRLLYWYSKNIDKVCNIYRNNIIDDILLMKDIVYNNSDKSSTELCRILRKEIKLH